MLAKIRSFLTRFWLPILSGILIGTSYIPFPPWAYPFCLVPLWIFILKQTSGKSVFFAGWITQFVLTFIGFNWVAHTAHEFGHMPMPVALLVLVAFAALANIHIPITAWLWFHLAGKQPTPKWLKLLSLAGLTALGDLHMQTIFPWNFGYPWLYSGLPAYHLAEYVGISGLSMITIFSNILAFMIWDQRSDYRKLRRLLITATVLFAVINGLGYWRSQTLPAPDSSANVLLVQANIGNLEKQYAEKGWGFRSHIINRYTDLTLQGIKSFDGALDLVVWPETAFPDKLVSSRPGERLNQQAQRLKTFVRNHQLSLVTGGYGRHPGTNQSTNSFYLLDKTGNFSDSAYYKTHLLAFGEYVPGAQWFPQIKTLFQQTADFARGPGPVAKQINGLSLGPQICYEVLFPLFSKKLADLNVQFFVNLTNDSWYGTWEQPYQHLYMSAGRSVEFRRPLVRSTNTGFTTVALADGSTMKLSPLHKEWFHVYKVPYYSEPFETFYQANFWLMPTSLWMLTLAALMFVRVMRKRPKNGQQNGPENG